MAVSVSVTPTIKALNISQHQQLTATVTGGALKTVAWSSGNNLIATVSGTGLVTAVAPGLAIITATSNDDATKTAIAAITVNGSHALHISDRHNNYIQSLLQDRLEAIDQQSSEAALIKQCLSDVRTFGND